ncbi:signal transducing kinase of the PAK [Rhizophlyctis rosea]|uniref:Signal transducing kinase of the PAK n=1 Tax=Rhizophlyctis rosea TaxID=64517 RepID=A0AAD5SJB4_9FUNG|nr:signal transducing kinase of the PAK [Rhizophlyctis rosea]
MARQNSAENREQHGLGDRDVLRSPELYGASSFHSASGDQMPSLHLNQDNRNRDDSERVTELSPNGRYAKMNQVLGKGAYKVVYKAIDREEGYEVAWNTCQTTKAEFMELSDEIDILKRVRHPNIIQFHDCWYNNMEFVFVTELMTSGTLREYIRKLQSPNTKIVKRWARQILKGLSYLHSHDPPIIHRDIKCDNIFINGAHGEVKIGDMGTAKMKLGKKYTVIGTPEFMAPEMYEEKGYSEKVDIYAFGMALLEMVTGEYPYGECKNAAQIYKKVTQGIKPECLSRVTDPEVLDLINSCIGDENDRLSAQQIVEHPFLAVEPEVVLVMTENKTQLTMQVVFKGMDKLSVKFEFNIDTDTAEEVVNEMIQEQVLPAKYQHLITGEINRILREMNRPPPEEDKKEESRQSWARNSVPSRTSVDSDTPPEVVRPAPITSVKSDPAIAVQSPVAEAHQPSSATTGSLPRKASVTEPGVEDFVEFPSKEWPDDKPIEELVKDTAIATNRGLDKASEWIARLQAQDVMTVGDLRELHDEDWASLGLTVFAGRALKNALYGKKSHSHSHSQPKATTPVARTGSGGGAGTPTVGESIPKEGAGGGRVE